MKRHLGGEDERYTAEFRMRHADGHWVWVQSTGRIFQRDADGRPLRLAGTHMDISRRKVDEQRLQDDARALAAANRQLRDGLGRTAYDLALLRGYVDIATEFEPAQRTPGRLEVAR